MNVTHIKPETVSQTGERVIPTVSVETNLIVAKFKGQQPGFMLTYQEIVNLVGVPLTKARSYIQSARRILLRSGVYIETVKNEGVRVATDDGVVDAMTRDVGAVPRALRRASRKGGIVNYERLSDDKKKAYNGAIVHVNTLRHLSTPAAVKKIEEAVAAGGQLPSAKVLELFKG